MNIAGPSAVSATFAKADAPQPGGRLEKEHPVHGASFLRCFCNSVSATRFKCSSSVKTTRLNLRIRVNVSARNLGRSCQQPIPALGREGQPGIRWSLSPAHWTRPSWPLRSEPFTHGCTALRHTCLAVLRVSTMLSHSPNLTMISFGAVYTICGAGVYV
jgi:hypothetical protein